MDQNANNGQAPAADQNTLNLLLNQLNRLAPQQQANAMAFPGQANGMMPAGMMPMGMMPAGAMGMQQGMPMGGGVTPTGISVGVELQLPDGRVCPVQLQFGAEAAANPQMLVMTLAQQLGPALKAYFPRNQGGGGGGWQGGGGGGGWQGNGGGGGGGWRRRW